MASPFPAQPAPSTTRKIRGGAELKDFRTDRSDGKMRASSLPPALGTANSPA